MGVKWFSVKLSGHYRGLPLASTLPGHCSPPLGVGCPAPHMCVRGSLAHCSVCCLCEAQERWRLSAGSSKLLKHFTSLLSEAVLLLLKAVLPPKRISIFLVQIHSTVWILGAVSDFPPSHILGLLLVSGCLLCAAVSSAGNTLGKVLLPGAQEKGNQGRTHEALRKLF